MDADATHKWWIWRGLECCEVCGIIRRTDQNNNPCKGSTRIVCRAFAWAFVLSFAALAAYDLAQAQRQQVFSPAVSECWSYSWQTGKPCELG